MSFAEEKLIEYLRSNLPRLEILNLEEILMHLTCLTQGTQEKLRQNLQNKGNVYTLWHFIDELRRRPGWVADFLKALRYFRHYELANEIEQEYNKYVLPKPKVSSPQSLPPSLNTYQNKLGATGSSVQQPMLVPVEPSHSPRLIPPSQSNYQNVPNPQIPDVPLYQLNIANTQPQVHPIPPPLQVVPPPPLPISSPPPNQAQERSRVYPGAGDYSQQRRPLPPVQPDSQSHQPPPYSSLPLQFYPTNPPCDAPLNPSDVQMFEEYKIPVKDTYMSIDAAARDVKHPPSKVAEDHKQGPPDAVERCETRTVGLEQFREQTQVHQAPMMHPSVASESLYSNPDVASHNPTFSTTSEEPNQSQGSWIENKEVRDDPKPSTSVHAGSYHSESSAAGTEPSREPSVSQVAEVLNSSISPSVARSEQVQTSRGTNVSKVADERQQNSLVSPAVQRSDLVQSARGSDPPKRIEVLQHNTPTSPSAARSEQMIPAKGPYTSKVVEGRPHTSSVSPYTAQSEHVLPARGTNLPRADVTGLSVRRRSSGEEEDDNYFSKPQVLSSTIDAVNPIGRGSQAVNQPLSNLHQFQLSNDTLESTERLMISSDSNCSIEQDQPRVAYDSPDTSTPSRTSGPTTQSNNVRGDFPLSGRSSLDTSKGEATPGSASLYSKSKISPEESYYSFDNSQVNNKSSTVDPRVYGGGHLNDHSYPHASHVDPSQPEEMSFIDSMDIRSFRMQVMEEPPVDLNEGNDSRQTLPGGFTTKESDTKKLAKTNKESDILIPSLVVATVSLTAIVLWKFLRD